MAYTRQLQEVKETLKKVFDKYSLVNSSYGFLKLAQFKEIVAGLGLNSEDVEIVYTRNKRKGDPCLVYETFLKAVIAVARICFPE